MTADVITVAAELSHVVTLAVLRVDELVVAPTGGPCDPGTEKAEVGVTHDDARRDARVRLVREMYRQLGIDPTKTRPSSEALWRRVRRGLALPRINSVVDACNRCSLETQLPFGFYDVDHVSGPVEFRLGVAGDEYEGIGKPVVHLAGRPALFDARGPFGNPTSDSARTMITPCTTRGLVIVYAPRAVDGAEVGAVLELAATRVQEAAGGVERGRWMVTCE